MRWVRLAIGLPIAIGLVWLTTAVTVAQVVHFEHPETALVFAPFDAVANATLADQLLQQGNGNRARVAALAQRALARSPLVPQGARILGLLTEEQGHRARARAEILYAARLSRRDLGTQLWLIDDAVARNDVDGALDHFDTALRTSALAAPILFPVLMSAAEDPEYVTPLARLLKSRQTWSRDFLVSTLQRGRATANVTHIVGTLPPGDASDSDLVRATVTELAGENMGDLLVRFAATPFARANKLQPATTAAQAGEMAEKMPSIAPLDWQFVSSAAYGAEPFWQGLKVYADSGNEAIIASRMVFLPAGSYTASSALSGQSVRGGSATWTVSCTPAGDPIAMLRFTAPATQIVHFTILPACNAQWLKLNLQAGDNPAGITAIVAPLRLTVVASPKVPARR